MFFTRKARKEVEELTWRTIDQEIDEPGFGRLEQYLRDSDEARKIYVESHWLHTALLFHFNPDYGKRFMPAKNTEQMFMEELMKSEPLADARELARKQRSKKSASSPRAN
ncbi:hypothetical protein HED60_07065 [Planctomycetales bacterium ZRK34]|nr:hypothetical protein HED60_07065 [Planctomycetales bacterium ZRK34]